VPRAGEAAEAAETAEAAKAEAAKAAEAVGGLRLVTYAQLASGLAAAVAAWLHRAGNAAGAGGLLLLDECHCLRRPRPAAARAVAWLRARLPGLQVLFCSATLGSAPGHLAHCAKALGLCGARAPFASSDELRRAMACYGSPLLELLALHLKGQGALAAHRLDSGGGAVRRVCHRLGPAERALYDAKGTGTP